jgi:membrane-associated protease RseP (regulator of RpoE activity)
MTTIMRRWPWDAGLALLLLALPSGMARGQDALAQEKAFAEQQQKIVADLNGLVSRSRLYVDQQNCQACHSVQATHPLQGAEPQGALNLTADDLRVERPFLAVFHDPADAALGATLEPVSDALRAQLGIPKGQGLVVASLAGDGPAADAGLQEKDVLLDVADKPLASADDLPKWLKAAGEAPVRLRLFRAGKPVNLQVRPIYRVTLGPVGEQKTDYYIGVAVAHPDETLRAHLELPAAAGLVANEIVASSPAEKAGVKVHDILLELDGKALDSPETLVAQVQAAGNKAATLKLLRGGKPMTLTITPELRKVESAPHHEALRFWYNNSLHPHVDLKYSGHPRLEWRSNVQRTPSDDSVDKRLDHLDRELKALRQAIDELRAGLKTGKSKDED